jgi:hypothetical protein
MSMVLYNFTLTIWIILSAVIFVFLLFIPAPYGRHVQSGWGPIINNKLGWIIMELWSPVIMFLCFLSGVAPISITSIILLILWEAHYLHRAFIYPFSIKTSNRSMPFSVVLSGIFFNFVNASLNGYYIFNLSGGYPQSWLSDPRFIVGVSIFAMGFIINRHSDYILSHLRQPGESGYKIPYGGLFNAVSCPNYLGEILIWCGWAIATWSLAGLSFAIWTIANLAPRARAHYRWYHENFPDYPAKRKILLPGIW